MLCRTKIEALPYNKINRQTARRLDRGCRNTQLTEVYMLDVCLPGTGGTVPRLDRFLCCCYMRYNGVGLLIDCGEGTQLAVKKVGFSLGKIGAILITHFHADHCSGLPGLLLSMGNEGHRAPLTIYGPKGIDEIVSALLKIAPELPFTVNTRAMGDFDTADEYEFKITSFELKHSCPCLGYDVRVERVGKFDSNKAKANGVPMEIWSKLQRGQSVGGFTPDMVLGSARRGIHVTYATDTRPCEIISTMAYDADLLICEGMFESDKLRRAKESSHMTMEEAARLARDSECHEAWLTHFSPSMPNPALFAGEPKAICSKVILGEDGISKTVRFAD